MHSKFSTLRLLCNAYDDMSNFSARSKHQRCYTGPTRLRNKKRTDRCTHQIKRAHIGRLKKSSDATTGIARVTYRFSVD